MGPPPAATHQRLQARLQFIKQEGLGQKVVSAVFQRAYALGQGITRGQHNHRRAVIAPAHALQHGTAVHAGQTQIEHHGIEILLLQAQIGHPPIACPVHEDAGLLRQAPGQPMRQVLFILHQQYSHRLFSQCH